MAILSKPLSTALIVAATLLAGGPSTLAGQNPSATPPAQVALAATPQHPPAETREPDISLSQKQKRNLMKANFEKMKRDADELAALAKSLQEDLDKSNVNILSLGVVEKAERIEKLAKKIKSTARGM